jgi:hypothetical protein
MYEKVYQRSQSEWIAEDEQKARVRRANSKIKYKKTAPIEKWVNRLGYHTCVSNYTGGNTINRLSGSSINRKIRENEKLEIFANGRTEFHAVEFVKRVGGRSAVIPAWVCPGLLSEAQVEQIRDGKRVSRKNEGDVQSLRVLSPRSKGIVRARCTAFYRACGNRKIFCTLTFINTVTDAVGISVLNKFLTVLRKNFPRLQYIWVAERQLEKTQNIHFHLIINTRIPITKFNALWVRQQYNSGIMHDKYSHSDIERTTDADMHEKLNPVDVRWIKNLGQLSGYLTKYITKGNNKGGFGCAVWHCSREVSQLYLRTIVGWEVVKLAKSEENASFNRVTGEYFGPPTWTAGRTGNRGGFLYMVYHINQPARFLCYLREMEGVNKRILSGEWSVCRVMEYMSDPVDESFICSN